VKYLLAQMNGNISIESQSNLGSKFVCNLSLKTAKESHKLLEVSHEIVYPDFDKKKSILLVEDSELIQLSILKILSSNGNFFLNIISNGEDVIPTLKNQEADIILISNTIQRYSAEELARSIKELSTAHKKIPILALSTEVFKEDLKRYKRSGIKDVISKPFDDKSLLDKLYKYVK
jgi:CheY-like chemotaxis protein